VCVCVCVCVCVQTHTHKHTANNLTTGEDVPELTCSHTEADTDLLGIYGVFRSDGYRAAAMRDTEDMANSYHVQQCKQHNYVAWITPGKLC